MRVVTLSYLVAYCVFSLLTKILGKQSDGVVLLVASMLACGVVWGGLLLAEHGYTAWRLLTHTRLHHRDDDVLSDLRASGVPVFSTTPPPPTSYLSRILPLLFTADVVHTAIASATILLASTLAYSQPDISLLLPLLLMKGGPNIWGVILSWLHGEGVTWRARIVLGLAVVAVVAVLWRKISVTAQPLGVGVALMCAAVYVLAYYPKLVVMSRYRGDGDFLVAEMTTTVLLALPAATLLLIGTSFYKNLGTPTGTIGAWGGILAGGHVIGASFATVGALLCKPALWVMALASEGAGFFGGGVFMARMPSAMSVSLNRCASLLGGFAATLILWARVDAAGWLHGLAAYATSPANRPELIGVAAMAAALAIGLSGGPGAASATKAAVEAKPLRRDDRGDVVLERLSDGVAVGA